MTVMRMDNVGIVVEDIDAAVEFFTELGLDLEGRATVEGDLGRRRHRIAQHAVEIAMMSGRRSPQRPPERPRLPARHVHRGGHRRYTGPAGKRGAKLVGKVVQYENVYRLCYIRGPEGILIGLAQQLGQQTSRENPIGRNR